MVVRLGAGQLALYKVAQKMHRFQFLEVGFPWSLECWAGEFLLQSFKSVLDVAGGASCDHHHHPQPSWPLATRLWRSTVCSASVLRRKWGGAAGSRGGPGPVP